MSPPRSTKRGGIIAIVVAVIIGLAVSCNGFREDEIACEQAVVHLRDCCPGFNASVINCAYHESLDCSDSVVAREYPALPLDDSRCVEKKSCGDLIRSGVCARAQDARQRSVPVDGGASSAPSDRVCTP